MRIYIEAVSLLDMMMQNLSVRTATKKFIRQLNLPVALKKKKKQLETLTTCRHSFDDLSQISMGTSASHDLIHHSRSFSLKWQWVTTAFHHVYLFSWKGCSFIKSVGHWSVCRTLPVCRDAISGKRSMERRQIASQHRCHSCTWWN